LRDVFVECANVRRTAYFVAFFIFVYLCNAFFFADAVPLREHVVSRSVRKENKLNSPPINPQPTMKRVCIYCASSPRIRDVFFQATEELTTYLIAEGIEIAFGGGSTGLMGKIADTVLEKGGKIMGIMPYFMHELEWGHKGVTDFHYTETMHQRKHKLMENVDAAIALAGGCGTFEELLEAITLKQLGIFNKPILILNTDNYYEPLKMLLENAIEEQFMVENNRNIYQFVDTPAQLMAALKNSTITAPQLNRNKKI
jgi:uncharacterized protein (TIGR00730 family)